MHLSEVQARAYVKAGLFPAATDVAAICNLQDVFSHFTWEFNISLLTDMETTENAGELFAMLFDESTLASMICDANTKVAESEHPIVKGAICYFVTATESVTVIVSQIFTVRHFGKTEKVCEVYLANTGEILDYLVPAKDLVRLGMVDKF